MNNQPRIRFKGYHSDWEQRKFSDLAETRRGLTYSPSNIRDSGIRVLRSSNIAEDQFTFGEDDIFVEPEAVNIPYANQGDILITSANGSSRLVGKHAIIKDLPDNSAVHGGFMLLATAKIPEFVNAMMSAPWYSKFISLYVAGGNGAIGNLNKNDLDEQDILVPDDAEQKAIGQCFAQLDTLITLHQRKVDKYKNIRTCFLQELFCSDSLNKPVIRFSVYTPKWEKMSLSNILTPYTDYLPTPTDGYTRLGIRSHMKGTFYEYVAPSKQLGEKRLQRVKRDNFIVNIVFAWEHAIAITTEEDEGKLVSHRFPQFSFTNEMYPRFFHYALNNERFRHHLWLASPSGAGRNKTLRIDEMLEYELRIPEYEEQKRIADFMTSLDNLIDLYEYQIRKLQNIKAACLQGMFV